jgi:hypothetical protein
MSEKNDSNLWDKVRQGARFIWKEHPTFRFLRWRVEWLNQTADQLNQNLNPFYAKPVNAPQTDRQKPTTTQTPTTEAPVIQPVPIPYKPENHRSPNLVNPDFLKDPFSISPDESVDRSVKPRSNPNPSPKTDPLASPEIDDLRKQVERERAQREQADRQQDARDRVRREQEDKARAEKEQVDRAQSERARRASDRRSDKIIEELEEANRRIRDGGTLPGINNPFDGLDSHVWQSNKPPNEADFGHKLIEAMLLSLKTGMFEKELLEALQKILTPEGLAMMAGLLAVVGSANIAAAAIGGPIGAGISTTVSGAMALLVVGGNAATLVQATGPLFGFLTKAYGAKTEAEFLAAASDFAKFVNVVGPDVVLNMTGAKAGQALGRISSKLASLGGEIGQLSPERQKQIRNGLKSGRDLLDSVGKNIKGRFESIFRSIDDALKHLTGEQKAANSLTGDGKISPGNGKKPGKPEGTPKKAVEEFPAGSPIKEIPQPNKALKTSTDIQNSIIHNIESRIAEKRAALKELAEARALGKSRKEIEKINTKIDQADDALVNAGATWKLAEEGVNITEFESKVNKTITSRGTVAEADIGGNRWWVETGNGGGGKLDQIIKALSNPEANPNRRSLIAYIPKFSESAVKQITDAGGYAAKDYQELSRLVKQAERGEMAVLNEASSLGRQFKGVLKKDGKPAVLPFDFNTLDHAFRNAVRLDEGQSGIKYGYIITKQDSKILIPGKSKATVLPIPGRDNQGVIVKFTLNEGQYKVELMTGESSPKGLVKKLFETLNLNETFKTEIPKQQNIPKGIHDYEGVIDKRNKTISEGISKEIYTAQAQPITLEQPSVGEQLRAKMNAQKLSLGWIDSKPSAEAIAPIVNEPTQSIKMLASSLNRQNRLRQALINQGKELNEVEVQAQIIAKAAESSAANSKPRPKQNQREM